MYRLTRAQATMRRWAFLARPRYRILVNPKMRLSTSSGCSPLARTFDLVRFLARSTALRGRYRCPLWFVKSCAYGATRRMASVLPGMGGVAPHPGLVAVQQRRQHPTVVHVGRARRHRVNELAAAVDPDVPFHAEEPLLALPGLAHLRVALAVLVLRRTRRIDERRIDDGAGPHVQSVLRQVRIDQPKQLLSQVVRLHQMAELAYRGLVGHRLSAQVNADKVAHRPRVIQCLFHRRVREVEPVLQQVNPEHALYPNRRPTRPPSFG